MTAMAAHPLLLVLSAPSGGGKTTIAKALLSSRDDVAFSVSATTRSPRDGEEDGKDYSFLTRDAFASRREAGDFVEWAEYGGELYGTLQSEIDRVLATGRHLVLDIEIEGARQLRERRLDVVSIFILPPSAEALRERLAGRSTDSPEQMARRLRRAVEELADAPAFDYVVTNADRDRAVADVAAILDAETSRVPRQRDLAGVLERLREGLSSLAAQMS